MKNILFLLIIIMPFMAVAQQQNIKAFCEKYEELDNVSNISLNGSLLKFTMSEDANEDSVNKVTNLQVMFMDEFNPVDYRDLKKLRKEVLNDDFEDLIQIREGTSKVDIMLREKGDIISNVLIIVNDLENFILFSLEGEFHLKDLENLDLNINGSEHLKKVATYPRA